MNIDCFVVVEVEIGDVNDVEEILVVDDFIFWFVGIYDVSLIIIFEIGFLVFFWSFVYEVMMKDLDK